MPKTRLAENQQLLKIRPDVLDQLLMVHPLASGLRLGPKKFANHKKSKMSAFAKIRLF